MAQLQIRANLLASDFALVSEFMGRSVLVGGQDQPAKLSGTLLEAAKDNNAVPEAYYMHNVMPTTYGYKSINYKTIVQPISIASQFSRIISVRDGAGNRGFLGITTDGHTYIISSNTGIWQNITPPGAPVTDVTVANVSGVTYICYAHWDILVLNIPNRTLTTAALNGITNANIIGITSSNNYMVMHDGQYIYWSNPLVATDFVPSLITGAGSEVPASIAGSIVAIFPLSTGFAVYTTANIIGANFTGNSRYPWIFREIYNGAGIDSILAVTTNADEGSNYAWTSAGLLKVALVGCVPFLPEVTDFLSGRIYEDFIDASLTLSQTYLTSPMLVRVAYSGSRYVIISYGTTSLTYSLVYDIALKRMGKLRIPHVAVIEFTMQAAGAPASYRDLAPMAVADLPNYAYSELITISGVAAEAKHTMAFLQSDGTIKLAIFDYGDFASDSVLIMGKYQYTRTRLLTIQSVNTEHLDATNNNFALYVINSSDGLTQNLPLLISNPQQASVRPLPSRQYNMRQTGTNLSLMFKGSFHLVSLVLICNLNGHR